MQRLEDWNEPVVIQEERMRGKGLSTPTQRRLLLADPPGP